VKLRSHILVVTLLAVAVAAAPLASTQAAEIGEGIEIKPANGPNGAYAQVGDNGDVTIQLDADAAVPGEGLPADTLLDFDRVFLILNANPGDTGEGRQAYVYVVDEGAGADSVDFYRGTDTDDSIEGEDNAVRLDAGESAAVGFTIDTDDDAVATGDLTFTVNASVSDIAKAVLDIDTENPSVGDPVQFNATASTGDQLEYTYDFDDGTLAADAGSTQNNTFDDPGTYNVTLSVEETAARAPNGSDSVTRAVVVSGPPQTAGSGEEVDIPNTVSGSDDPAIESVSADPASGVDEEVVIQALANESVADAADGNDPNGSTVVGGANVSVPDAPDVDATVTLTVDRSDAPPGAQPADLAIERYNGTAWQVLPTAVQSTTGNTVTLVAETPGFSPFAVTVNPDAPTLDPGGDDPGAPGGGGGDDDTDDADDVDDTPTPDEPADTATPPATEPPTATPPADTATPPATEPPTETQPADTPAAVDSPTPPTEPGGFDLTTVLVAVALLVAAAVVLFVRYRDE
jgi:PGF-pre-PGF domain-containing protein